MSQASSQAWAFYREVAKTRVVWAIRDDGGFPSPMSVSGQRAMPFWSSKSRAQRIIENAPAYAGFTPVEIGWSEFVERWIPGLEKDGLLAGVNWSGPRVLGYDLRPTELREAVEAVAND